MEYLPFWLNSQAFELLHLKSISFRNINKYGYTIITVGNRENISFGNCPDLKQALAYVVHPLL